jgi:hypothetical protein
MTSALPFETTHYSLDPAQFKLSSSTTPRLQTSHVDAQGRNLYVRHASYVGFVTPVETDLDRADSSFQVSQRLAAYSDRAHEN